MKRKHKHFLANLRRNLTFAFFYLCAKIHTAMPTSHLGSDFDSQHALNRSIIFGSDDLVGIEYPGSMAIQLLGKEREITEAKTIGDCKTAARGAASMFQDLYKGLSAAERLRSEMITTFPDLPMDRQEMVLARTFPVLGQLITISPSQQSLEQLCRIKNWNTLNEDGSLGSACIRLRPVEGLPPERDLDGPTDGDDKGADYYVSVDGKAYKLVFVQPQGIEGILDARDAIVKNLDECMRDVANFGAAKYRKAFDSIMMSASSIHYSSNLIARLFYWLFSYSVSAAALFLRETEKAAEIFGKHGDGSVPKKDYDLRASARNFAERKKLEVGEVGEDELKRRSAAVSEKFRRLRVKDIFAKGESKKLTMIPPLQSGENLQNFLQSLAGPIGRADMASSKPPLLFIDKLILSRKSLMGLHKFCQVNEDEFPQKITELFGEKPADDAPEEEKNKFKRTVIGFASLAASYCSNSQKRAKNPDDMVVKLTKSQAFRSLTDDITITRGEETKTLTELLSNSIESSKIARAKQQQPGIEEKRLTDEQKTLIETLATTNREDNVGNAIKNFPSFRFLQHARNFSTCASEFFKNESNFADQRAVEAFSIIISRNTGNDKFATFLGEANKSIQSNMAAYQNLDLPASKRAAALRNVYALHHLMSLKDIRAELIEEFQSESKVLADLIVSKWQNDPNSLSDLEVCTFCLSLAVQKKSSENSFSAAHKALAAYLVVNPNMGFMKHFKDNESSPAAILQGCAQGKVFTEALKLVAHDGLSDKDSISILKTSIEKIGGDYALDIDNGIIINKMTNLPIGKMKSYPQFLLNIGITNLGDRRIAFSGERNEAAIDGGSVIVDLKKHRVTRQYGEETLQLLEFSPVDTNGMLWLNSYAYFKDKNGTCHAYHVSDLRHEVFQVKSSADGLKFYSATNPDVELKFFQKGEGISEIDKETFLFGTNEGNEIVEYIALNSDQTRDKSTVKKMQQLSLRREKGGDVLQLYVNGERTEKIAISRPPFFYWPENSEFASEIAFASDGGREITVNQCGEDIFSYRREDGSLKVYKPSDFMTFMQIKEVRHYEETTSNTSPNTKALTEESLSFSLAVNKYISETSPSISNVYNEECIGVPICQLLNMSKEFAKELSPQIKILAAKVLLSRISLYERSSPKIIRESFFTLFTGQNREGTPEASEKFDASFDERASNVYAMLDDSRKNCSAKEQEEILEMMEDFAKFAGKIMTKESRKRTWEKRVEFAKKRKIIVQLIPPKIKTKMRRDITRNTTERDPTTFSVGMGSAVGLHGDGFVVEEIAHIPDNTNTLEMNMATFGQKALCKILAVENLAEALSPELRREVSVEPAAEEAGEEPLAEAEAPAEGAEGPLAEAEAPVEGAKEGEAVTEASAGAAEEPLAVAPAEAAEEPLTEAEEAVAEASEEDVGEIGDLGRRIAAFQERERRDRVFHGDIFWARIAKFFPAGNPAPAPEGGQPEPAPAPETDLTILQARLEEAQRSIDEEWQMAQQIRDTLHHRIDDFLAGSQVHGSVYRKRALGQLKTPTVNDVLQLWFRCRIIEGQEESLLPVNAGRFLTEYARQFDDSLHSPMQVVQLLKDIHSFMIAETNCNAFVNPRQPIGRLQLFEDFKKAAMDRSSNPADVKEKFGRFTRSLADARVYDPNKCSSSLWFEHATGFRLREKQNAVINEIVRLVDEEKTSKEEAVGILFQLMMGQGKTAVVLSELVQLFGEWGMVPIVANEGSQHETSRKELENLQRNRFGTNTEGGTWGIGGSGKIDVLMEIRDKLIAAKNGGGCMVIESVTMRAIIVQRRQTTVLVEKIKNDIAVDDASVAVLRNQLAIAEKKLALLEEITDFFSENCIQICDECHINLDPFVSVNISGGKKIRFTEEQSKTIATAGADLALAWKKLPPGRRPDREKMEEITLAMLQKQNIFCGSAEEELQKAAISFILRDIDGLPAKAELITYKYDILLDRIGENKEKLCLLKGITEAIFASSSGVYGENFGFRTDQTRSGRSLSKVVPYLCAQMPSSGEYDNPVERAMYYYRAYMEFFNAPEIPSDSPLKLGVELLIDSAIDNPESEAGAYLREKFGPQMGRFSNPQTLEHEKIAIKEELRHDLLELRNNSSEYTELVRQMTRPELDFFESRCEAFSYDQVDATNIT
ncbi:MAG: hypothetical protein LBB14_02825, partial [Puniceicoccales bacterium]|nr:hypothetical protein [Puniceicoccales bacterium]